MEFAETGINTSDRSDSMTTIRTCHSIFSKNIFCQHKAEILRPLAWKIIGRENLAGTAGELLRNKDAGHDQRGGTPEKETGGGNFEKDYRRAELSNDPS
jgi:hypothetical protein